MGEIKEENFDESKKWKILICVVVMTFMSC